MKTITRFSKDFIKTCVAHKICNANVVRDYDIVKAHESGMSLGRIAIKYQMSKTSIKDIVDKYKP